MAGEMISFELRGTLPPEKYAQLSAYVAELTQAETVTLEPIPEEPHELILEEPHEPDEADFVITSDDFYQYGREYDIATPLITRTYLSLQRAFMKNHEQGISPQIKEIIAGCHTEVKWEYGRFRDQDTIWQFSGKALAKLVKKENIWQLELFEGIGKKTLQTLKGVVEYKKSQLPQ